MEVARSSYRESDWSFYSALRLSREIIQRSCWFLWFEIESMSKNVLNVRFVFRWKFFRWIDFVRLSLFFFGEGDQSPWTILIALKCPHFANSMQQQHALDALKRLVNVHAASVIAKWRHTCLESASHPLPGILQAMPQVIFTDKLVIRRTEKTQL